MDAKMRIGLLTGLALLVMLPALVSAQSVSGAISVYNLQTNPNPIVAGQNVTLSLQLYDSYSSTLNNVNLQLEGSYPILNFSPVSSYILSSMSAGLYGGSQQYFTYNIRIPKNTPSGTYTLDLVANYETTATVEGSSETLTGQSVMPVTFYVNGAPSISVSSQSSGVTPGTNTTVKMTVQNTGYATASNVTVNLENTPQFTVQGTSQFQIGTLAEGSSAAVSAVYQANQHLANGTYAIPFYITYASQSTGRPYNQTSSAQVTFASGNPNVVVNITSAAPSTLYRGYNQSLVLTVSNVGTGTAKNVSVSIKPRAGIQVLSSVSKFYINSLAAGQSTTESLLIAASNSSQNGTALNAQVAYSSQNYASHYSKSEPLNLSVASAPEFSISEGNYTLTPGATAAPIRFVVKNTGNIAAQQVQVTFQSTYPISPVTGSYYIANLSPGQSVNVSFTASVQSSGATGNYPVTIYETWRQPNGASQQLYSGSNAYYAVVSPQGSGGLIEDVVIVIVILAIVAYVMRKRMAASKKKADKKK